MSAGVTGRAQQAARPERGRRGSESNPPDAGRLPAGGGTYVLWLRRRYTQAVEVGRLGTLTLAPGYYAYVGSALGRGGLRARLGFHARMPRRPHWHIDYLKPHCALIAIWYCDDGARREPAWVEAIAELPGARVAMRGFGACDGAAQSHLYHFAAKPSLQHFRARLGGGAVVAA